MLQKTYHPSLLVIFVIASMLGAIAQAADIKPLHHVCTNVGNTPALPSGTALATQLSSVAPNVVSDTDVYRFICPVGYRGSFEYQVRDRKIGAAADVTNVRAISVPASSPAYSIDNASGDHTSAWGNFTYINALPANGVVDVRVTRIGGINPLAARAFELCVLCYRGNNGIGPITNVIGTLIQNQ